MSGSTANTRCLRPSDVLALLCILSIAMPAPGGEPAAALPAGVRAVWDITVAEQQTTTTRQRICLNGLWQWQPAGKAEAGQVVPSDRWGYFKVPGCWPGITDYMQKDCQTVFTNPAWAGEKLSGVERAWYQREFTVPGDWTGRRIALQAEYVNSYAAVYVDGRLAGEVRFPAGEVDLTAACRPGAKHTLSLFVVAMPLKGVLLSYTDSASAREVKGRVERRGLCGDVYLVSAPAAARIGDVRLETSVRNWKIAFDARLVGLAPEGRYTLSASIGAGGQVVKEFTSSPFTATDVKAGRLTFDVPWKPDRLWDIHTPQNMYDLQLSLRDDSGKVMDTTWSRRFGFREFWIDGRDFYLNGSRIFLSSVPLDNAQVGAAWATYEATRESLRRLKSFGINFVYTHNYGCEPGDHLSFAEILRAADDEGMLVSLTQPHFSHYDWKTPEADSKNGYATHAAFYAQVAENHPSVIAYAMSHNATGYSEDMNPDMIDGIQNPRDQWSANNVKLAMRAEAIVKRLDPGRIVYHHASGNLGVMHASNYYANFAPIQEQSDWFEHWATKGVKPLFTCEYAVPFTWDWTMYRGWYKGQREFGSAKVPWEFCLAEWNAQFVGDRAYQISEPEKANLRWEAKQFRAGNLWHRWDYPAEVGSTRFDERYPIIAMYINDNWPAFRTWGVSANSPWEYGHYWKLRDGVNRGRQNLKVDWDHLQRPGFSADYIEQRYERMDLAYEPSDWIATPAAKALIRTNMPLLGYIAGKPAAFTSKDHNFMPGETVEKQIVIINNSRQTVTGSCSWLLGLRPQSIEGSREFSLKTGQQQRIRLRFQIPASQLPDSYPLMAGIDFSTGESQTDGFSIRVLPRPVDAIPTAKIALFDPKGETSNLLTRAGAKYQVVDAKADLSGYEVLIIGKAALTIAGDGPDLSRVREGLRVICFEQTADVLEKRLGFRVAEYGLRSAFERVANHPIVADIAEEWLGNWRGEATLLPPRLTYEMRPRYGPTVQWCDIPVTRLWRCGNRGNVASVLIETPARGDFLPIIDGGYGLQYSPLMEYREGKGMVIFCQLDVTGRTENDPAADMLARNIVQYVSAWKPSAPRKALYAGEPAGRKHLESTGIAVAAYPGEKLAAGQVLIVGPGGGRQLAGQSAEIAGQSAEIAAWLKSGGRVLAVGLDEQEANAFLPTKLATKNAEHIASYFEPGPGAVDSPLRGIASADVHNRDPRTMPLVVSGATVVGDGVLAMEGDSIVFCQMVPWQFDALKQPNLKRTHRRASVLLNRLLGNLGVASATPLLARFNQPIDPARPEQRWLDGLYVDRPEEWDDPYRFFRW